MKGVVNIYKEIGKGVKRNLDKKMYIIITSP